MPRDKSTHTSRAMGRPSTRPVAGQVISSVAWVCGAKPPVCITISPRSTAFTPRVKIIEGTRR